MDRDTLRIEVNAETQPVAVAMIEAEKESLRPTHGLAQARVTWTAVVTRVAAARRWRRGPRLDRMHVGKRS